MKKIILCLLTLIIIVYPLQTVANAEGFSYDYVDDLYSESFFMVDTLTGNVIFSENADEERSIASLTKIMTYIVAYENIPNIETVEITVTQQASDILKSTNSSLAGVEVGETYTGLQLLNLMMIPSGNDAALVLALYYDEINGFDNPYIGTDLDGVDVRSTEMVDSPFIALMNEKAAELGCENTNFTNPHGLYNENHYSTARDVATFAQYAMTLPYFSEITNTKTYTFSAVGSEEENTVYSSNKMFSQYESSGMYYYQYATGMKTGSLNEAGYCIAATAVKDGDAYLVIVLGSPYYDDDGNRITTNGATLDAVTLFKWAFSSLSDVTMITAGDLMSSVEIKYAWDKTTVQLVSDDNVKVLLPSGVSKTELTISIDKPEYIEAPVQEGDVIAVANIYYGDMYLDTVNLVANETVELSQIIRTWELTKGIFQSPWFITIAILVVIILILYITFTVLYNRKKKRLNKVRKYRVRK